MIFSTSTIDDSLATIRRENSPQRSAAPVVAKRSRRDVAAKYEAADTNSENRRRWANADPLSADGQANPVVRRTLRNRNRLVHRNNPYFCGMTSTIGIEVIGTGPQLQIVSEVESDAEDKAASEEENSFAAWMRRDRIAEKLRSIIETEDVSGEVFIVQSQDAKGDLTYIVYEPDHVQGNGLLQSSESYYDGIHYDEFGRAIKYDILNSHPGDNAIGVLNQDEYRTIDAEYVFHYYTATRPGQRRGVPSFSSAIELFEDRRSFRHAVLSASETAASFAAVIQQDIALIGYDDDDQIVPNEASEAGEEIPLNHRVATTLPPGHTISQVRAEQPTTGYKEFDTRVIAEAARCVNMPYILAALDSSGSNLAGAYLDFNVWRKAVAVRRDKVSDLLDWIRATWRKWYLYGDEPIATGATHTWRFPELAEHADPSKVATANAANLESGATTYAEVYGRRGMDEEKAEKQRAKELGLTVKELRRRRADKLYPPAGAQGNQPVGNNPKPKDRNDNEQDS